MEPKARHAALASIVSKGVDGALLRPEAGNLLGVPGCLMARAGSACGLFHVENLDDAIGLAEDKRVLGGREGDCRDFLLC